MEWAFEQTKSFLNFPVAWNQGGCIVVADRRRNATDYQTKNHQKMKTLIVKLYEVHGMTIDQIAIHLELSSAYVRAVVRGSI